MFDQLGVRLETIFFATEFNLKFYSATDNHKILVKKKSINNDFRPYSSCPFNNYNYFKRYEVAIII